MSPVEPEFPALRPNEYRDAWCGQVLPDRVGRTARVAGWVHRRRDHGGLVFIDLRDRTGLVQLVFNPHSAACRPEKMRPLNISSAARDRPTMRGTIQCELASPMIPRRAKTNPSL